MNAASLDKGDQPAPEFPPGGRDLLFKFHFAGAEEVVNSPLENEDGIRAPTVNDVVPGEFRRTPDLFAIQRQVQP